MAYEDGGIDRTFLAAEDLSGQQYRFVVMASDTTVQMPNAATDFPIGVLQNAPESGEEAVVRLLGVSKLVMNDAVAVGAKLKMEYVSTTDNGKGDAADTDYDISRAICIIASGAENDVGTVLLCVDTIMVA